MGGNISCVKYPLCPVSTICGCLNIFICTHNDFKNTVFFQIWTGILGMLLLLLLLLLFTREEQECQNLRKWLFQFQQKRQGNAGFVYEQCVCVCVYACVCVCVCVWVCVIRSKTQKQKQQLIFKR